MAGVETTRKTKPTTNATGNASADAAAKRAKGDSPAWLHHPDTAAAGVRTANTAKKAVPRVFDVEVGRSLAGPGEPNPSSTDSAQLRCKEI
jgi:hypothetical protein